MEHHRDDLTTTLRVVVCGSVDDGKSTLIGRLAYEASAVPVDHLEQLRVDSPRFGTQGTEPDFALLLDGLIAEREQGITIDVAYRFLNTPRRRILIADAPGHEQYTRNMISGASTSQVAVIVVDARHGVLTQTRRHTYLASLLGIRNVAVVINKMDLVGWSPDVFTDVSAVYRDYAGRVGITDICVIPVSALLGDNVTSPGSHMPWYAGPPLLEFLQTVTPLRYGSSGPFRFPVQWVNRPSPAFRGLAGTVIGERIGPGDPVVVLPSGSRSRVARVVTADGDLDGADAGRSVTITLTDAVDVSRGDVLCSVDNPATVADQLQAHLIWMSDQPMLPTRPYRFKLGTHTGTVRIDRPKHVVDIDSLVSSAATTLRRNDIGLCNLSLDRPVVFDPYHECQGLGGLIVIDPVTKDTVAAGMVKFALRRSQNLTWQHVDVDAAARRLLMGHRPAVVWFTGISGAGKSTIANAVERRLVDAGVHTYLLDGDNVRHGLNRDLGFTDLDRIENIRRIAEVARLMADAGLVVLVACISPFRADRRLARSLIGSGSFWEVFVDTPVEVAEARDRKGLYAKARRGELPNFTAVDQPYERPEAPEVHIVTQAQTVEQATGSVLEHLRLAGMWGDEDSDAQVR